MITIIVVVMHYDELKHDTGIYICIILIICVATTRNLCPGVGTKNYNNHYCYNALQEIITEYIHLYHSYYLRYNNIKKSVPQSRYEE